MNRQQVYWLEYVYHLGISSNFPTYKIVTGWVDINHMKDQSLTVMVYGTPGFKDSEDAVSYCNNTMPKELVYMSKGEADIACVRRIANIKR